MNYVTANEKLVAIPYTNGKVVTIGVYQFPENQTDILTIHGGYQFAIKEEQDVTPYNFLLFDNVNFIIIFRLKHF